MKKFIFSAVALMAFSFAGMANEIEETKTLDLKQKDCLEYVVETMSFLDPDLTMDDSLAAAISYAIFVSCDGGKASVPAGKK